tara:strand:- start:274 stop:1011 length:738 start_codon:yes stop_codon:yes gene_type:complete
MQQQKGYSLVGRSLFIALPAYDFKVSLKLAISLAQFARISAEHGIVINIGSICGCSVVSRARNLLMQDFLESKCTDLLFIDSDINFSPDDVLRLMAWTSDPKKGIVAGVPRVRGEDKVYITTLDYDENNQLTMNGTGLVRAKRVATAFMMVRREVFETLVKEHPEWLYDDVRTNRKLTAVFDFKVQDGHYMGEDFLFCDRARAHGYEVWIDPAIKLGHMGVQEYLGDFGKDALYPLIAHSKQEVA